MPKFSNKYDSADHADIRDSINASKTNKLNIKNVSNKINSAGKIIWLSNNIFKKYKNILAQYTVEVEVKDHQKYKPHFLSKEYYGTQDLWYLIMLMNDMTSVMEFTKDTVKVFDKRRIELINKILVENQNKLGNTIELEDLTYKKI